MSELVILAGVDSKNFFRLRSRLIEKIRLRSRCVVFCGLRAGIDVCPPGLVVLDNGIEGGKFQWLNLLRSWVKFLFSRKRGYRIPCAAMAFGLFPSVVMVFYFFFLRPTKAICVLTGLGKLFENGFLSAPPIRNAVIVYLLFFYQVFVVQNRSDYEYLRNKVLRFPFKRDIELILGSGFDSSGLAKKLNTRSCDAQSSNCRARFLYIGRFVVSKGIIDFIDAAIRVVELGAAYPSQCQFTIAGFPYERSDGVSLEEIYRRIDGYEEFFTVVDGSDGVLDYLARTDFLVSPSQREGLGLSVIEAMAFGVPVIGYDVAGINDLIIEDKTGWLVRPGDIFGLAERIRNAAGLCKGVREEMSVQAREHFNVLGLDCVEVDRQYLEVLGL